MNYIYNININIYIFKYRHITKPMIVLSIIHPLFCECYHTFSRMLTDYKNFID